MTAAVKRELPRGFDLRLLALTASGERRKYTHFKVQWFEEHYEELMVEVKKRLGLSFAPSMDAKFATRAFRHKWLVTKIIKHGTDEAGALGGCRSSNGP